jgi:hypothetical protein
MLAVRPAPLLDLAALESAPVPKDPISIPVKSIAITIMSTHDFTSPQLVSDPYFMELD